MASTSQPSSTFHELSEFSLGTPACGSFPDDSDSSSVSTPTGVEEPVSKQLEGLRSLSVSEETPSDDKAIRPHSPIPLSTKRARGSDFDEDTLAKTGRSFDQMLSTTPPKAPMPSYAGTPEITVDLSPVHVTPPTPPRLRSFNSDSGSLAARRAASGKLPNKALLSLQQMRFESKNAGDGLGVGPGSPGFEGMEGISPGPGLTFRLALGLASPGSKGDVVNAPSSPGAGDRTPGEEENFFVTTPSGSTLGSPSVLRSPSNRRRQTPRSPSTAEPVKIPPTLRGSKILDKLNLSSPPTLTSPLSPRDRPAPPSPLIMRTSAFTYSNTGPLTPLTPSHLPGAPNPDSSGGFDWSSYSMPDTPGTPLRSVYFDTSLSPTQPFFLPTPPTDSTNRPGLLRSQSHIVSHPLSPLGDRRNQVNPFFEPLS